MQELRGAEGGGLITHGGRIIRTIRYSEVVTIISADEIITEVGHIQL